MTLFQKLLLLSVSTFAVTSGAQAAEITTEISTGVSTSTANNGAADDLTITSAGSIEVTDTDGFTAVTVDSSNDLTVDGLILIEESDLATGILIQPGLDTNLTLSGDIQLLEDYEREDTDDDDDLDGPLASGTGRTGILLQSGGAMTGDIYLETGSTILVEGNGSAGILLNGPLNGDFRSLAGISVVGDAAQGITASEVIDGDMILGGSVSAQGEGATGVRLDQGVTGTVQIGGSISATGFAYLNASNYVAPANVTEDTVALEDRLDADELLTGGPALSIGGSLGRGLLINGTALDPDLSDDESEDETKDTVEDFNENRTTGRLVSYGSAPALLISADLNGPATSDLVLGAVSETVFDTLDDDDDDDTDEVLAVLGYDYGLINRGVISGIGTNVGFDGTAVLIEGSESTSYVVRIEGGIENTGTLSASAYEANATGLRLGANAETPLLVNIGTIQAALATEVAAQAIGVDIGTAASLPELFNSGTIIARSTGNSGEVAAVRDLSGTLTSITNTGIVTAAYFNNGVETTTRDGAVAFDLSANTAGVTLHQYERAATYDANGDDAINALDTLDPSLTGRILFGSGNDLLLLEGGTVTGDISFGAGSDTFSATNTEIVGDTSFSGTDAVYRLLTGATHEGTVAFDNNGLSQFVLSGGATFKGTVTNAGSALDLSIDASRAQFSSDTELNLTGFSLTNGATLLLDIGTISARTTPVFTVSGAATLSGDVEISPIFSEVSDVSTTLTLIDAASITADIASGDVSLIGETPFIYLSELDFVDGARDQLNLVYRLKTADELGMDLNQAAAFDPVLEVLGNATEVSRAFAGISTEHDFYEAYDQLLPQRTDASTRFLRSQTNATFGAVADQMTLLANSPGEGVKGWVQETLTLTDVKTAPAIPGYDGTGFALAAGLNLPVTSFDAFGVMITYNSGSYEEKTGGMNPVTTSGTGIGAYAIKKWDSTFLRGVAQASSVHFTSLRNLSIISGVQDSLLTSDDILDPQDITDSISGDWKGYSYAASLSAGTEFRVSSVYARPEVSIDYFGLHQDAYSETALRYEDLAVSVAAADTASLSGTALLAIGADWGMQGGLYRMFPEARIGVRQEFSQTPYETTARFLNGTDSFSIESQDKFSDAILGGISFNSSSSIFTSRLSYDVEVSDAGTIHYLGVAGVLKF